MVSYRAVPITTCTSITGYFLRAILVENTVVVGLLKCVCHTIVGIIAGLNAVLDVRNSVRVYEVANTLGCPMTFTRWTPEICIYKL